MPMPGAFVVHFDGHVSQLGTFGTLAMGIRRNILEAFVRERISMKVPHTVRVNLRGALQKGVMARDVFHQLVRVAGAVVVPLPGPGDRRPGGLRRMSTEGLQTITGLAMFTGAVTAIVNPARRAAAIRAVPGAQEARAGVQRCRTRTMRRCTTST